MDRLISESRRHGLLTAREISEAMHVSQPTASRLISGLGIRRVARIGRARSTRYAMRRSIRGLGSSWPLYCITPNAVPQTIGRLHALEGGRWYVEQDEPWDTLRGTEFIDGIYPGLPWFLQDLRPRGFLGRSFARRYAAQMGTPSDPLRWSDDDIAVGLVQVGEDLSGALVVGGTSLAAAQAHTIREVEAIDADAREMIYPAKADASLAGEWPGSSAAGEQPKFTARVSAAGGALRHVIVKFNGSGGRPEDRRWADLLVAEHMANTVLSAAGVPCADTSVLQAAGRFFLESTRFDRVGPHGRRGLVSLEALDAAFFGAVETPWTDAAARMLGDGWINAEDADRLSLRWWFGTLIGNTDMHYGNVSLFLASARPLGLAPTYDMVPMQYRPDIEGRFSDDPVTPAVPSPDALTVWSKAAALADRYWSRLSCCELVSSGFRGLASANAGAITMQLRRMTAG